MQSAEEEADANKPKGPSKAQKQRVCVAIKVLYRACDDLMCFDRRRKSRRSESGSSASRMARWPRAPVLPRSSHGFCMHILRNIMSEIHID